MVRTITATHGETIIGEGDAAESLFNVVTGWVKIYKLLPDGRRQITGFLSPGDFLGLAVNDTYAYSAEAVTDTQLCRFPRKRLESFVDDYPHLEKKLLSIASNELIQAQDQMLLLGRKTAKERIASFLLNLSGRAENTDQPASPVSVPMTRSDIADFLGLTTETVSRTFSSLKKEGHIRILDGHMIALEDPDRLHELAEGD